MPTPFVRRKHADPSHGFSYTLVLNQQSDESLLRSSSFHDFILNDISTQLYPSLKICDFYPPTCLTLVSYLKTGWLIQGLERVLITDFPFHSDYNCFDAFLRCAKINIIFRHDETAELPRHVRLSCVRRMRVLAGMISFLNDKRCTNVAGTICKNDITISVR